MRFSQRIGKTPVQMEMQIDTMDDRLRNRLFNVIQNYIDKECSFWDSYHCIKRDFTSHYCDYFGELYRDNDYDNFFKELHSKIFFDSDVYFFYDFMEFTVKQSESHYREMLLYEFNRIFNEENVAYRFSKDAELMRIADGIEFDEVNISIENSGKYKGVDEHLEKARKFFSDRKHPDYKKSIEESIHAIESIAKVITGNKNAILSDAIKKVPEIHPALQQSIEKLYAFSGDASGVRHGNKYFSKADEKTQEITADEARFILVTSHSIVNYLRSRCL